MPHVQHDYFSSFIQSDHCFLASSLPLPSSFLKLPNSSFQRHLSNSDRTPENVSFQLSKSCPSLFSSRCPKDGTVVFHRTSSMSQRFSFEVFQFLNDQVEPYLYVHCEVELCNLTDSKPSCLKDCNTKVDSRLRRSSNKDVYDLEQGPILILRKNEDISKGETKTDEGWSLRQGMVLSFLSTLQRGFLKSWLNICIFFHWVLYGNHWKYQF